MNKKEVARDNLALGSIAFYILVMARALIGPYWEFLIQLITAGIFLMIISLFIKNTENHISRLTVLTVFTILFYNQMRFTIFVIILFCVIILSALVLKIKKNLIMNGIILGILSSIIGFFITSGIVNYFNL